MLEALVAVGRAAGLDAVGVAPATPFERTRRDLEQRKADGLAAGMQFTYRNPARSTDPGRALDGARSLVVGALSYAITGPGDTDRPAGTTGDAGAPGSRHDDRGPSHRGPAGRVARYARRDHYADLRAGLTAVSDHLRANGWRTRVLADDNALVDREAAVRAGLGWYGKNTNVLLPGRGSWFVLGSVVTDAPLPPSDQPVADGCGACTRCLDGCPTQAIVAPGVVDARRCLAWLVQAPGTFPLEFREALGDRIYGCDDCQEVCPPNRRTVRVGDHSPVAAGRVARPGAVDAGRGTSSAALHPSAEPEATASDAGDRPLPGQPAAEGRRTASADAAGPGATVRLIELLDADDDTLVAAYGRWYIAERAPRYLRRNALVALGNVGRADDPEVGRVIGRALHGDDELLREHATWAAERLDLPVAAASDLKPAGSGAGRTTR